MTQSNFYLCTPEKPWKPEYGMPVQHKNVEEIGDQESGWPSGDIQRYRCKDCGATWKSELPQ